MKYKLLMRRLSVSAPRMRIKTQRPWYVQALFWLVIAVMVYVGGKWVYQSGLSFSGHAALVKQVEQMEEQVQSLTSERDDLTAKVNAAESGLQMERSTQEQLSQQIRALTAENNRLKEELGFYQAMSSGRDEGEIVVRSARISQEAGNQWRYRVLLMQNGKASQDFTGQMQLVLTLMQEDKNVMMTLPEPNATNRKEYDVSVRRFQKLEGIFNLPQGAVLKAVQIRILERGNIRVQQNVEI
ncbi:MAG: hypothetical protein EPO06_07660 [Burkholderiaceae bacterium]|nr:MAG: hypothetical protein EPO06_07660 [Burkholderiaceae bacterium]